MTDVRGDAADPIPDAETGDGRVVNDHTVRAERYLSDPSNHTPSMALFGITVAAVDVLQKFTSGKGQLLSEVHSRGVLHERFRIVSRLEITPTFSELDQFKLLAAVYTEDGWSCATSPSVRPTDKMDPYLHLQVFDDKASTSKRFSQQTHATMLVVIVQGGPAALAVTRECNLSEGSLPQSVANLVRSGRAFDNIEDLALKFQQGRAGSQLWI